MNNANETRDIYGTILFNTYETLIQRPSIDPHKEYIGLQGSFLNPYLAGLLTHGDQITQRTHHRMHHEGRLIDNMSYNGCGVRCTITSMTRGERNMVKMEMENGGS
jgi:hypothetical protein